MKKMLVGIGMLAAIGVGAWAANELSLSLNFNYTKGVANVKQNQSLQLTVNGTAVASGVVAIGTVDTAISLGTVTNAGVGLFINTSTNADVIQYGTVSNVYPFQVTAGNFALVQFNTNSLHAVGTTNSPNLFFVILSQ